jgi:subtilisin family serine protease
MAELTLSLASLAGRSGRGVRIAVVDSGVYAAHPHVGGIVVEGVAIDAEGRTGGDGVDRLGHGTAVAAAIREKALEAELVAVKVFDRSLSTTGVALVEAIRWAAEAGAALINLSLGTANAVHEPALAAAVREANDLGSMIVAAAPQDGVNWLPGALPGVIAVQLDWECPRDVCRLIDGPDGGFYLRASGFPRPIPGVPPAQNEKGQSFAVANATGLVALAIEGERVSSWAGVADRVRGFAKSV